jgi:hypothetical protein
MRIVLAILSIGVLASSCSHAYYVRSIDSKEFRDLETRAARQPSSVILDDGTEYEAKDLKVAQDSTAWTLRSTSERMEVSTELIRKIVFRSRSDGAVEGAGIGFLGAGLVGGALGAAAGTNNCAGTKLCISPGQGFGVGFIVFGLAGAVLGAMMGASNGATYAYYLFPSEPVDRSGQVDDWDPWR